MFGTWPNITGRLRYLFSELGSGSFSVTNESNQATYSGTQGASFVMKNMTFDSSLSNTTYGGSALQPKALSVLACIRI